MSFLPRGGSPADLFLPSRTFFLTPKEPSRSRAHTVHSRPHLKPNDRWLIIVIYGPPLHSPLIFTSRLRAKSRADASSCRYVSKVLDLGSLFTPRVPFNRCDKALIGEQKEEKVNMVGYWWYFSECLSVCLSVTAGPLGFPEDPQCVPYLQGSDPVCPLHSTAHISGWQKIREETNPAKWIKMKITLAGIHPNSATLNQGPVSHRPIEVRFFSVYFLFASKKREQGRTKKKKSHYFHQNRRCEPRLLMIKHALVTIITHLDSTPTFACRWKVYMRGK